MKMNWGKGIAILYISFVVFIGVMVYLAFGEKFDLVTEDYYQKEIEFQSKIDKKENVNKLEKRLKIAIKDSKVIVEFPQKSEPIQGTINVFRPSDESLDFEHAFREEEGIVELEINKFQSGKYVMKTDWKSNELSFYQEEIIIIP